MNRFIEQLKSRLSPSPKLSAEELAAHPEKLMLLAMEQAKKAASVGDVPIGAALWVNGEVLATGFNQREHHHRAIGHAEVEAIELANRKLKSWRLPPGAVLAVTVEPCLMCTGALLQARISKVIYGCGDTKNAGLRLVQTQIEQGLFDHRMEIQSGVLAEESARLLSQFFKERREQKKKL